MALLQERVPHDQKINFHPLFKQHGVDPKKFEIFLDGSGDEEQTLTDQE